MRPATNTPTEKRKKQVVSAWFDFGGEGRGGWMCTARIFPSADLQELFDVGDFAGHLDPLSHALACVGFGS